MVIGKIDRGGRARSRARARHRATSRGGPNDPSPNSGMGRVNVPSPNSCMGFLKFVTTDAAGVVDPRFKVYKRMWNCSRSPPPRR